MEYEYPVDYLTYSTDEVCIIVDFLSYLEDNKGKYEFKLLESKYKAYRKALNSIQEEKRINKEFYKLSGIDIYKTLREYSLQ